LREAKGEEEIRPAKGGVKINVLYPRKILVPYERRGER